MNGTLEAVPFVGCMFRVVDEPLLLPFSGIKHTTILLRERLMKNTSEETPPLVVLRVCIMPRSE
jgi:hypothetical protein